MKKISPPNNQLDQDTITKIQSGLEQRKNEIIAEMNKFSGDTGKSFKVKFPNYGSKSDENAQEIDEYTTNLATEKVLESTLRDIDNALDRIKKGTYGICKYCRQPIGSKRLLARPVANTCVACKTKLQTAI
jgi:RNA polymerase-binding protein DksA